LSDTYAKLASPTFTGTVSGINALMVGLGNVNDTSDANKPISNATQAALNLKAPLASPSFTGLVSMTSDVSTNGNIVVNGKVTGNNGLTITSGQISLPGNSIADSALSGNMVTVAGSQTLTNKTITTSGLLTANAGVVVTSGDVSLNNNLVIGGNTTVNGSMNATGAFMFGSLPVTKYYMWTGSPSVSTITSPMVKLTFGNNSFYAKIHCFLSDGANHSNMSSQILEVQGGNTAGTTPAFSIISISRNTTANSYYWSNPTFDTNSVYLGSESFAGVAGYYTIRVELIQTNGNSVNQPTLQSITMTNNNSGGVVTTTYNY
jgi:acetyltransferase-like isoleucine patch superfamily enzyme